jgi:LmbE family N-acetylglucosaminyl deacetylase
MARVLVLSPHPDDEAIGCGGTLCRHADAGDVVDVVVLTSGERGGHGRSEAQTLRLREREARKAAQILGIAGVEFWRQPDGALRASKAVVARLRTVLARLSPEVVYVTHDQEAHPDHRAAARLLARALTRWRRPLPRVLMFEIWTPIQRIDAIVDISQYLPGKLRAIRAYRSQCAEVGFVEAARGLARYRGEMHSWPGGDYAEVFKTWRP